VLYRNGFCVDDGRFRAFGEPSARVFVQDILDGYFPTELKAAHPQGVPLQASDQVHVRYSPPEAAAAGSRCGAWVLAPRPRTRLVSLDARPRPLPRAHPPAAPTVSRSTQTTCERACEPRCVVQRAQQVERAVHARARRVPLPPGTARLDARDSARAPASYPLTAHPSSRRSTHVCSGASSAWTRPRGRPRGLPRAPRRS